MRKIIVALTALAMAVLTVLVAAPAQAKTPDGEYPKNITYVINNYPDVNSTLTWFYDDNECAARCYVPKTVNGNSGGFPCYLSRIDADYFRNGVLTQRIGKAFPQGTYTAGSANFTSGTWSYATDDPTVNAKITLWCGGITRIGYANGITP